MNSKFITVGILVITGLLISACNAAPATTPTPTPVTQEETTMNHDHAMVLQTENDFINGMIPHHLEAIETSKTVVAQTTDPELKEFAQNVIKVQTDEVAQLKKWLSSSDHEHASHSDEECDEKHDYASMMGDLSNLQGTALDKAYVQGMIAHHEGAIDMAQQVLKLNPRPEVKKMAEDIITVQQQEIETLQGWLQSKFGGSM